jgi:membrane protease YdiL (CAAX protease family)
MMKSRLIWAGLITLFGFPLIGWFLLQFFHENALEIIFRGSMHALIQLPLGLGIGWCFGLIARWVITRPFMQPVEKKYALLIRSLRLNTVTILLLSFCAGFGEELLFRGALQPLLGIWITAIIFVAIHGYLNPLDWRISIYGGTMTLLIVCLGWMTEIWGIFAACAAHMAIDIVLFRFLVSRADAFNYLDV